MFKFIEFIRLYKKGFRFKTAFFNDVHISNLERVVIILIIIGVILVFLFNLYKIQTTQLKVAHTFIKQQRSMYHVNLSKARHKVSNLEMTFISCLNGSGVIISGRNMDCIIKEYK